MPVLSQGGGVGCWVGGLVGGVRGCVVIDGVSLQVCGLVRASGGFLRGLGRRRLWRAGGSSCVLLMEVVVMLLHLYHRWLEACLWLRAVVWASWWEFLERRSCWGCLLVQVLALQELV